MPYKRSYRRRRPRLTRRKYGKRKRTSTKKKTGKGIYKRARVSTGTSVRKFMRPITPRVPRGKSSVITVSRRNHWVITADHSGVLARGKKLVVRFSANHPGTATSNVPISIQTTPDPSSIIDTTGIWCEQIGVADDLGRFTPFFESTFPFKFNEANPPDGSTPATPKPPMAVGFEQFVGDPAHNYGAPGGFMDPDNPVAYRRWEVIASVATIRIEPMQHQGIFTIDNDHYLTDKWSVFHNCLRSPNDYQMNQYASDHTTLTDPAPPKWQNNGMIPINRNMMSGSDPFNVMEIAQTAKRVEGYLFKDGRKNGIIECKSYFGAAQRKNTPFARRVLSNVKFGQMRSGQPPGIPMTDDSENLPSPVVPSKTLQTPWWKHLPKDQWEHRFVIVPERMRQSKSSGTVQQGQIPDFRITTEIKYKIKMFDPNPITSNLRDALGRLTVATAKSFTMPPGGSAQWASEHLQQHGGAVWHDGL